ncbi:Cytochrome P450 76T24 [Euphorbia peplus]|nr:Cytochrome P450 76T24 [Euphorbia peplus]
MDLLSTSVLTLAFTLTFIGIVSRISDTFIRKRSGKLPPGPYPLPIVGNLFQLGSNPHKSLAKLAQMHGPLMSLKLGQIQTIVISSPSLAKQIFQTHDLTFLDRIVPNAIQTLDHDNLSMIFMPFGPLWKNLRKTSNTYLFSNHKLDANQHIRSTKIQRLIADVEQSCCTGTAVEFDKLAFRTSLDIMSGVIFSLDLADSSSEIVTEFKELVKCIANEVVKPNLVDYFPVLRYVSPQQIRHRVTVYFRRIFDLFDRIVDQRVMARNEHTYVPRNDMLDSLLILTEGDLELIDRNNIKHLILDLITAGTDTTASTLEWAMAELLRNPETMRKARAEIEKIISKDNMIKESDVAQLPYLRAIIKETFRLHPAVPLLVPRKAGTDVEIGGYTIPKDAQVMVNVWAIGRDLTLWENPDVFMPERHLGSEIDVRGQHFELIPFGGGRRICPGLPLAMRMLPVMLGSLIHCFDWKLEHGAKPKSINMDDCFGTSVHKAQPLRAIPVQVNCTY